MKAKLIHDGPQRTYALVFEKGDEAVAGLARLAEKEGLGASRFTGLGAFSGAVLGFFDWDRKDYDRIAVDEQVEVVALIGDITREESGGPQVHPHAVLSRRDGTALGGHLLEARVRPTLEVIVTESPAHLCRRRDPDTGLALITL